MNKKRFFSIALGILIMAIIVFFIAFIANGKSSSYNRKENAVSFVQVNNKICREYKGKREEFNIKGVSLDKGYPGIKSNENFTDEDTFYRWIVEIAEMNANTIRLYELMPPEFYKALYKYNTSHKKNVYILQGIAFPEEIMFSEKNIFSKKNREKLSELTFDTIDAIHGKKIILNRKKENLAFYVKDVSDYVEGYILGNTWDETFVEYTNQINKDKKKYNGKYFKTATYATGFENFLTQWADKLVQYEVENYDNYHMISFSNSGETDPFINDIKRSQYELEPIFDANRILKTKDNKKGAFASYVVYPYYPLFLQVGEYTKYKDEEGNINPYRYYLKSLVKHHDYPVIVSEYGMSISRNSIQNDYWRHLSQGGLNETEQADAVITLYNDITKSGCAGSILMTWHDDWKKTDWNERGLFDPERSSFWNNVQSTSRYGLLAFSCGDKNNPYYPDGDFSEWKKEDLFFKDKNTKLSFKSDAEYLHFMVEGIDKKKDNNYINIAIDTIPESGKNSIGKKSFNKNADFVLKIAKKGKSAIYVNKSYDLMAYSIFELFNNHSVGGLAELQHNYDGTLIHHKEDKDFVMVSRVDGNAFNMLTKKIAINKIGILKEGNGNPNSKEYDSNADYCVKGNRIEGRIPWQLINFYDPSKCKVIDNFEENEYAIKGLKVNEIHAAAYFDDAAYVSDFGTYELHGWNEPEFYERLRPLYYKMQNVYGRNEN